MFRSYQLQPITACDQVISFEWDPITGELRGEDAALISDRVESAIRSGGVTGHPHPTAYKVADPLHSLAEMAVILGNDWLLSPDLASAYPRIGAERRLVEIKMDGMKKPSGFEPLY